MVLSVHLLSCPSFPHFCRTDNYPLQMASRRFTRGRETRFGQATDYRLPLNLLQLLRRHDGAYHRDWQELLEAGPSSLPRALLHWPAKNSSRIAGLWRSLIESTMQSGTTAMIHSLDQRMLILLVGLLPTWNYGGSPAWAAPRRPSVCCRRPRLRCGIEADLSTRAWKWEGGGIHKREGGGLSIFGWALQIRVGSSVRVGFILRKGGGTLS